MRWFLICLVLSVAVLTVSAPAASACLNDREVLTHEKEFKSQYLQQPAPPPPSTEPSPSPSGETVKQVAYAGLGAGLFFAALLLGIAGANPRR
jgi:hypothetical protein